MSETSDLNLLLVFEAMFCRGSVTRAAAQIGLRPRHVLIASMGSGHQILERTLAERGAMLELFGDRAPRNRRNGA
ncbi:MAG: hypothetical protein A3G27_01530 [Betaproteobacteria bacterium RIFCSPLOWO2_12_FULL_66_14]|nr:MAG: hypothetical protein A3G27_01530 [Betaproteobacteria bacterium RIFCSPLOWO2_12_FULL_66_14]